MDLPIQRGGVDAKFGLDLAPLLARIAGAGEPGTYLVGLRPVDGAERHWLRLQVTDLSLTAVEEADRVRFAVTSLATARPVAGAEIRLEGLRGQAFVTLARGRHRRRWQFWSWRAAPRIGQEALTRIVVIKGDRHAGARTRPRWAAAYAEGNWTRTAGRRQRNWLDWTVHGVRRAAASRRGCCATCSPSGRSTGRRSRC